MPANAPETAPLTDPHPISRDPATKPSRQVPAIGTALCRGLRGQCPACGNGRIFARWLKVVAACSACATPLGTARADDAPPYFTILIVGHLILPAMLWLERAATPPLWLHSAIWLPLTVILSLALLQPIKGATVGAMLRLGLLASPDHA